MYIKVCWCRNNYQVKSGMGHLGKRKDYLTCNLFHIWGAPTRRNHRPHPL